MCIHTECRFDAMLPTCVLKDYHNHNNYYYYYDYEIVSVNPNPLQQKIHAKRFSAV